MTENPRSTASPLEVAMLQHVIALTEAVAYLLEHAMVANSEGFEHVKASLSVSLSALQGAVDQKQREIGG